MRISHRHKFIFLCKPKCASTSIREALSPFSDISGSNHYPFHYHTTPYELREEFRRRKWQWTDYFSFTTVRNPWALAVSAFTYSKPDKNGYHFFETNNYDSDSLISFKEWIKGNHYTYHQTHLDYRGNIREHIRTRDFSGITLQKYTCDEYGKNLVDRVIKIENLEAGMNEVCKHIGIPTLSIPNLNRTSHGDYRSYYDDESKKIVAEEFASDIEFGKYQF